MAGAVLFGIVAALALAGGVGVVAARRPVYNALSLLLVLLALAVDYLLLQAQFIAVLQVIVYAGAIVVLFVFVVMLLQARSGEGPGLGAILPPSLAIFLCALFGALLLGVVAGGPAAWEPVPPDYGTVQQVGRALFAPYVLPFEAASVVLLIGMVGAVALGKRLPTVVPRAAGAPGGAPAPGLPRLGAVPRREGAGPATGRGRGTR